MRARIASSLVLTATLFGCSSGAPPSVGGGGEIAPATGTVTPAGSVVYSPNVYVLDAEATNLAQVASGRLVFPVAARGVAARKAGDILVSSRDGGAVFLRRVVSVEQVGSTFVVATTDASVTDAIQEAHLHYELPMVTESAPPTGGLFGGKIDFAFAESWDCGFLNCQTSTGMRITPKILPGSYFDPGVRLETQVDILGNKPVLLRVVAHCTLDALMKLGLKIEQKGSFRFEGKMFETPEFPIPLGDIPSFAKGAIVWGAEGELYAPGVTLELDGGFRSALSAGFQIEHDGAPQGILEGGQFTPVLSAAFDGVGAEVKARRYFALKVEWMIGVPGGILEAGPQLTIRHYNQNRWYADSLKGVFEEDDTGHDVTITGAVKELGLTQSLSLKLADWTDSSAVHQFTGPFAVFPCASASNGDYCGGETVDGFRLGVPGHLYTCGGGRTQADVACAHGCGPATGVDAAVGKRVACEPAADNPCHAAADGNYCGNESVNGFTGGKLGLSASAEVTCAGGVVSHEMTCAGGCGPVGGGARVGCLTPDVGPSAPCGAGDQAGPHNGTCGRDGRVYYCYQGTWRIRDDCVAKGDVCQVQPAGVADICVAPGGHGPSAPCGAGDQAGPHNGTCGPDGRVYYCYQGTWRVKDDCLAKGQSCVVEPPGTADVCQASSRRLTPPNAPCGAGDQAGPHNGTCGPDGRVYYCYQGTWRLKDDCVSRGVACVVEAAGVSDKCTSGCGSASDCAKDEACTGGRCVCPGPVCGTSCCGAGEWCGSGSRCCSGCGPGCPC